MDGATARRREELGCDSNMGGAGLGAQHADRSGGDNRVGPIW